jgi:putative phage-type endonuclease
MYKDLNRNGVYRTMDEVETALILMYEYVQDNLEHIPEETFTTTMINEVRELMEVQFTVTDEMLRTALLLFPRGRTSYFLPKMEGIHETLDKIRKKPQPVQRTPEWYEYRRTLITASCAYKALGSDAKIRELLKPRKDTIPMCTEGPMHWGVKYEPVSIQYYTHVNQTKIEEFGCVTHDTYSFLGASPDGINVCETSPLYGRMLEIKNPYSRELTGIPKKEYWIQCQVQMEVFELEGCDFLETVFKEYETEEAFKEDGTFQKTATGKYKGVILQFFTDTVHYEYAPFQCTEEEYHVWETEQMNERTWVRTIYWRLEDISCVLIKRNKPWFDSVVPQFIKVNAMRSESTA